MFEKEKVDSIIARINLLTTNSQPVWGKMSVSQMLSHCCVSYELVYENYHPKPKGIKKWLLTKFVKPIVVSEKPYKNNSRTAPEFIIVAEKDFDVEKKRLIEYIIKTQTLGEAYFDQLESHAFGKLTVREWNTLFSKHLEHHLKQFGV
ncbi:DUF1569 domain-containing protein [bacterium]|nr:DUF1569 domain-containing protein [bacterium]